MPPSASSPSGAYGGGRLDSTVALDLSLNIADSVKVVTRVRERISAARDTVRAELQRLTLAEGGRDWTLERPARLVFGPRVEIDNLALRAGPRSITMNGVLDRHGTSDLTLGIAGLDLEALRASGLVPIGRRGRHAPPRGPAHAPRFRARWVSPLSRGEPGDWQPRRRSRPGPGRASGSRRSEARRRRPTHRRGNTPVPAHAHAEGHVRRLRSEPPRTGLARSRADSFGPRQLSSRCCRPRRRLASTDS